MKGIHLFPDSVCLAFFFSPYNLSINSVRFQHLKIVDSVISPENWGCPDNSQNVPRLGWCISMWPQKCWILNPLHSRLGHSYPHSCWDTQERPQWHLPFTHYYLQTYISFDNSQGNKRWAMKPSMKQQELQSSSVCAEAHLSYTCVKTYLAPGGHCT